MKIKLKANEKQLELIKAIGGKDLVKSREALEMLAGFIAGVIKKVMLQASTTGAIFSDLNYNEDDDPSIPLDLFYDQNNTQWVTVWSQNMAGGLPTSQVEGVAEMKVSTYRLDSAVSFAKKYARKSRLDVISKAVERLAQEILIKQDRNNWAVILRALGEATTAGADHIITSTTADVLQVDDFSRLMTLIRRMNTSWAGGTPTVLDSIGLTDLYVSPEMKEQIRGWAYNPMNTRALAAGTPSNVYGPAVALPDNVREEIYRSAGSSEIFGINIVDLNELGISQKYNTLFATFAPAGVAHSSANFATASHEILVGFDLSKEAFISPIAQNADSGSTVSVQPDDQWVIRSDKAGYYASVERGAVCIDATAVCGLIC
jgi:hypothetical protein